MTQLKLINEHRCFSGSQRRYTHRSRELSCEMVFGVFLPPQALAGQPVPTLYWLSGLTCTDENFSQKAGAQRRAAELGLALVMPDTSPRGPEVPDDPDKCWDFGHGAGFYVDAVRPPWNRHYRMHSYVVHELPDLLETALPLNQRRSISGHSMGGHGALVAALRHPDRYCSVSAFAPIANPSACPWGQKAFHQLLGAETATWGEWDASNLLARSRQGMSILVDQGTDDPFISSQLHPEALVRAAEASGQPLTLRRQAGYDHSYFCIASFIDDHLDHHGRALRG